MNWKELVLFVCQGLNPPSLADNIENVAEIYSIEKELILAVVHHESRCINTVVGSAGEIGLMQVSPVWHTQRANSLGVNDLFDPRSNVLVGSDILNELKVQSDPATALAIYNGGYTPPAQSLAYAKNVIVKYHTYKALQN